jgi:plastocyanin
MSVRSIRSTLALTAASFLVVALVAAAVASPQVGHTPTRVTKTVRAISQQWSPATVRITAGDTIQWKAISNAPHTVTAYGGNWTFNKRLDAGGVQHRRFAHAGTFLFRCRFHSTMSNGHCSGMCGKVVVSG